jgi:hypothetical protein
MFFSSNAILSRARFSKVVMNISLKIIKIIIQFFFVRQLTTLVIPTFYTGLDWTETILGLRAEREIRMASSVRIVLEP